MGQTQPCVQFAPCRRLGQAVDGKLLNQSEVARDAGLSRESLYKALSGERSPGFDTILKVIGALGLKFQATASTKRAARSASRFSGQVAKRRAA